MPWTKVQSGNKSGKAKGVKNYGEYSRKLCGDGKKISMFWFGVWTRNAKVLKEFGVKVSDITLTEQMKAAEKLEDRGFGKAVQGVDFGDGTGLTITLVQDLRRRFD